MPSRSKSPAGRKSTNAAGSPSARRAPSNKPSPSAKRAASPTKRAPSAGKRAPSNGRTSTAKRSTSAARSTSKARAPSAGRQSKARATSNARASSVRVDPFVERCDRIITQSREAFETARLHRDQEESAARVIATDYASGKSAEKKKPKIDNHSIPLKIQFLTYFGYTILLFFGYMRETFRKLFPKFTNTEVGYARLVRDFDDFYQRRFYTRIRDCWNRPINSRPSRIIGLMERQSADYNKTFTFTGRTIPCVNMGSYNYLGFADEIPYIRDQVIESIDRFGVGSCAAAEEFGRSVPLYQLEKIVAAYLCKDDSVVCGMGFATNFAGLPALFDKNTLVFSDQLNHASLVAGIRISAGKVQVFPHNRFSALERMIEEAIVNGQPRTHLPWQRMVIIVEGIYSMEGEIVELRRLIQIKKKYRCQLYIDEAHSIGALGPTGRGVVEYSGVDPDDVDIFMGTFTKSFGSIGGYIAGSKDVIEFIRHSSTMCMYGDSMSPGCCQQALGTFEVLTGEDGTDLGKQRIKSLHDNAAFFRNALIDMGLAVLGEDVSPVVPVMLYQLAKMPAFSRAMLARNVAVVVVGYPATPLLEGRCRFCLSASHTREDLQHVIDAIREVSEEVGIVFRPQNIKRLEH
eukprot:GILI01018084.1.p1 GENE.GILI01018084.1~~GILI01018084.1.p1  ORF type:complete len:631 (-),score=147.62 GILI01018084.1:248-2140(-)